MKKLPACADCPNRIKPKTGHDSTCAIDGRTVREHIREASCPDERFVQLTTGGASRPRAAIPRSEWPRAVCILEWFRRKGDNGVGDTLARILGVAGGEAWKKAYKRIMGEDCGCADRQAKLNGKYPY